MLFLTRPVVVNARAEDVGRDARFDFFRANAEAAYGRAIYSPAWPEPLREGLVEFETYGAAALRIVLAEHGGVPTILFDCRPSPASDSPAGSYRLAVKAGLRTTPPVLLSGQGGIEALLAMRLHAGSVNSGTAALVSSSGIGSAETAPGDLFAAACLAGSEPFGGQEVHIRAIHIARSEAEPAQVLDEAIAQVIRAAGVSRPAWIAVSQQSAEAATWSSRFASVGLVEFNDAPHPDPLMLLDRGGAAVPEGEVGILACLGAAGFIGVVALSLHHGDVGKWS